MKLGVACAEQTDEKKLQVPFSPEPAPMQAEHLLHFLQGPVKAQAWQELDTFSLRHSNLIYSVIYFEMRRKRLGMQSIWVRVWATDCGPGSS